MLHSYWAEFHSWSPPHVVIGCLGTGWIQSGVAVAEGLGVPSKQAHATMLLEQSVPGLVFSELDRGQPDLLNFMDCFPGCLLTDMSPILFPFGKTPSLPHFRFSSCIKNNSGKIVTFNVYDLIVLK